MVISGKADQQKSKTNLKKGLKIRIENVVIIFLLKIKLNPKHRKQQINSLVFRKTTQNNSFKLKELIEYQKELNISVKVRRE